MPLEATRVWSWWWNTNTTNKSDQTSPNILTLFVPLVIIILFIYSTKKENKANAAPVPPGPRGLPFIGYLPFLNHNLHHCFQKLATIYGPIFKLWIGNKHCIVVTSPSLVKEIVRDQDVVFANRVPIVAATTLLFGTLDIAFSNYGPEWRKMRKIFTTEMLGNAHLDASYHLRKQNIKRMLHETCRNAGNVIDVGEVALTSLVGSVMSMIWGDTLEADKCSVITAEFRAVVNELLQLLAAPNVSDFFPLLAWFDLQGIDRRVKIISRKIDEVFDKAINHLNVEDKMKQRDFLGKLLPLTNGEEDSSRSLTLPQVKSMLMVCMCLHFICYAEQFISGPLS